MFRRRLIASPGMRRCANPLCRDWTARALLDDDGFCPDCQQWTGWPPRGDYDPRPPHDLVLRVVRARQPRRLIMGRPA